MTVYREPAGSIVLNEKLEAFTLRLGTRSACPLAPLLFSIVLGVLVNAVRQESK